MDLQDDSFARFRERSDHLGDERVFSKRVVVEVPDVRCVSEGVECGRTQRFGEFSGG